VNYYFALVFFVASYVVLRRFVASPIGKILIAIRENEERASLVGYNVFRYKLLAFVISALFTGLAGALYAIRTRYASADYFSIILSGEAIVWAIIGGSGTLIGPIIGVAIINPIIYYVGVFWRHYLIIIGLLLILVLRFSTKGIVGVVKSRLAGRRAR
ncbi:MAG: branched-chain amino acid ABC transporter permease, partial [Candidatus Hecatellales archaeon]